MHPLRLAVRRHWPLLGLIINRDVLTLTEHILSAIFNGVPRGSVWPSRLSRSPCRLSAPWRNRERSASLKQQMGCLLHRDHAAREHDT